MPGRNLSQVEERLKNEWLQVPHRPGLRSVTISGLRGFQNVEIEFPYPITALAGPNGSGKTTVLSVAACAYHRAGGNNNQFVPPRKWPTQPYYTFSDFFVSSRTDGAFLGARIEWHYFGADFDVLTAEKGTRKWMHYDRRPNRSVAYLGLDRVLPACDLKVLRSYFGGNSQLNGRAFSATQLELSRQMTRCAYEAGQRAESATYHIYTFTQAGNSYTSFHMGAGEEVVCEFAYWLTKLPRASLLLIEEVEVGLHPELQRRIIEILVDQSNEKALQVILTTHSPYILDALPNEARVFLQRDHAGNIQVIYGIPTEYAMSLLSGRPRRELWVYVEDKVARSLLQGCLTAAIRKRTEIVRVGSWMAMASVLATHRLNPGLGAAAAILDADTPFDPRGGKFEKEFQKRVGRTLTNDDKIWLQERCMKLPGDGPPEKYVWDQFSFPDVQQNFCEAETVELEDVRLARGQAPPTNWHNVPYHFAQAFGLEEPTVLTKMVAALVRARRPDFAPVLTHIEDLLN